MNKPKRMSWAALFAAALLWVPSVQADPVVYTLRTVVDGQLGSHAFSQALVVIEMRADTRTTKKTYGSNGGVLYTNAVGVTTVSITDAGKTTVATFLPGEIYVRYDAGAGIAGFGSAISPSYPFALGCNDYAYPSDAGYAQDCAQADWGPNLPNIDMNSDEINGTANVLAGVAYGALQSTDFSAALLALPADLNQSTLLTGRLHACAGLYTVGQDYDAGNLQACSAVAPRGLRTDAGGFYVRDLVGGTNQNGPYFWSGWYTANSGSLQVEVLTGKHPDH